MPDCLKFGFGRGSPEGAAFLTLPAPRLFTQPSPRTQCPSHFPPTSQRCSDITVHEDHQGNAKVVAVPSRPWTASPAAFPLGWKVGRIVNPKYYISVQLSLPLSIPNFTEENTEASREKAIPSRSDPRCLGEPARKPGAADGQASTRSKRPSRGRDGGRRSHGGHPSPRPTPTSSLWVIYLWGRGQLGQDWDLTLIYEMTPLDNYWGRTPFVTSPRKAPKC